MLADAIIKDFNVFETGSPHFRMGSVTQAMVPLVLETVKPTPLKVAKVGHYFRRLASNLDRR